MNSVEVGRLGEIKVITALVEQGYEVYTPFGGNTTYDLLAVKDLGVYRVEVKTVMAKNKSGTYSINIKRTRHNSKGNTIYPFDNTKIDMLAVYIHPITSVMFLDPKEVSSLYTLTIGEKLMGKAIRIN